MAINNAKIISFDFFDTLFVRPLADPEDAFDIIGNQFSIPNFRKLRQKAQKDAFRQMVKNGKKEITLRNIYDNYSDSSVPADTLMQAEYELEKKLVMPNAALFGIFTTLISQGKTVVITSDMYFGTNFFNEVLLKYDLKDIPLFISADRNATKRDYGEMFDLIVDAYGVAPQEILHIGDNYLSDVQRPRERKLAAFHYQAFPPMAARKSLPLMSSLAEGMLRTISADSVPLHSFQELGFKYQAPATLGFLSWIAGQSKADGVDHVLFVSRDGHIPERVARRYFGADLPPFSYFKGSRIAFNLALIDVHNFNQHIPFLISGAEGLTPAELLERIGLEPPLQSVLTDLGFQPGITIGPENYALVTQFITAYRGEILKICQRNRRGLFVYLKSMNIKPGGKVALVDIGWSGSTQEAFELAIAKLMDLDVVGYYFCLANTLERQRRSERQVMKALISSDSTSPAFVDKLYENRVVIELFFSAPHPTVIGYKLKGTTVTAVDYRGRADITNHINIINQLNDGIDVFLDDFIALQQRIGLVVSPMEQVRPLTDFATGGQWLGDERFTSLENFDSWGSTGN
ncbi:HAD family hydrolase [Acerihabitans arboris]|uniref:Haloacid dehalogenase n=1 Tax=Acerihabitans arboris TaxID=2691583 RepID=A0A845SI19_9GAMM|nr:haloacid dehalogenase [Acerihabitans arboris]NDL62308.1 haloacid dehalogenase [Acerihabitans arboris]